MYIEEGKSSKEAESLAKLLYRELRRLDQKEYRLWKSVRKYEVPFTEGLENG
jgi:hypothetical protein